MARLKLKHSRYDPPVKKKKSREEKALDAWPEEKKRPAQRAVFLPEDEHLVKMIAMQGADDDEIAEMFGVDPKVFETWRRSYPSFNKALDAGRLAVDAKVTYKLYEQTQGFKYQEQTATPKGGIVTIEKFARPDTSAIKYWLENRRPDLWRSATTTRIGGSKEDGPVGLKVETRNDLIDAIVNMLHPKPDGANKPVKTANEQLKK